MFKVNNKDTRTTPVALCTNISRKRKYHIQKLKITALKYHHDNFDKKVVVSDEEKTEIQWRINNTDTPCHQIATSNPNFGAYIDPNFTDKKLREYTPTERSVT